MNDVTENDRPHTGPTTREGRKIGWLGVMLVVFLLLILAFLAATEVRKQHRKSTMHEGMGNMKSLFYLMIEYDSDNGMFPGGSAEKVDSPFSNDYFGRFFSEGYTQSEEIFYFKGGGSVQRKPDNIIDPPERILEAGECGYALIVGSSTQSRTSEPIILAPMGRSGTEFNPDPMGKQCVILRVDGAVKVYRLNAANEAVVGGGKTLFASGAGSVWAEGKFDIKRLKHAK